MFHPVLEAEVSTAMRETLPEAPPLAISFFTFEFVHYLVDRRRGTFPIRKPVDFILFAIFFPTLVAGPIKRYKQFLPSLRAGVASVCPRDVMTGLLQASLGCVKKVCADNLTGLIIRRIALHRSRWRTVGCSLPPSPSKFFSISADIVTSRLDSLERWELPFPQTSPGHKYPRVLAR